MDEKNLIPNTDFKNDKGLVSLSFRKVDGGFYLTENFSKSEYAITNTGGIHGLINQVGVEMLKELDVRFQRSKKNDVVTIEFQIREGAYPLLFGAGIIGLNAGGITEATLFAQLMSSVVYVLGVSPTIFGGKKYKTTRDGFAMFMEDVRKTSVGPFVRPMVNNDPFFNPFGFGGGIIQTAQPVDFIEVVESSNLSPTGMESQDSRGRIKV